MLEKYSTLYANELIFDWNICDWFCVRALGAMIKENGEKCAEIFRKDKEKQAFTALRQT